MTLLLDSSNTKLSVGIAQEDKLIDFISYEAWQRQSEVMVKELDNLLKRNSLTRNDITDIVVSIGPGSYTGVRIALTIAKVISFALNIPIYPVSSLRILKDGNNPSICLINARSNRSYIGVYEQDQIILNDQIMTNDKVIEYINCHPSYSLCGDVKYLGLEGVTTNACMEMVSLKKNLTRLDDTLFLKPVYMKD